MFILWKQTILIRRNHGRAFGLILTACTLFAYQQTLLAQTAAPPTANDRHQSERSDALTGGHVETAEFAPDQPEVCLTLNVPSFRLTLWQNGKEVRSWYVGVGMKDHPIYIGDRKASQIIWNPDWIPPDSPWVGEMKSVTSGEVIKASDPRNPLGKMKIPLGDRYLIHQAASVGDVGNLVSHGCVRMLRSELYELADKIIAARSVPVSTKRIAAAKRSSRMYVVNLDEAVPVDINYDTLVVEDGSLHVYPDVYGRGTNTTKLLRAELQAAGVDESTLSDRYLKRILAKVGRRTQFIVPVSSISEGQGLLDGKILPLIPRGKKK